MCGREAVYLDLGNNNINAVLLPEITYTFLNLHGNHISEAGNLAKADVFTAVFDYSDDLDFTAFEGNKISNAYIVECPPDKQLSVKSAVGYGIKFVSNAEAEKLPAELSGKTA